MQHMLRIVLVCLLVVGLPLKGYAAACMMAASAAQSVGATTHDHSVHGHGAAPTKAAAEGQDAAHRDAAAQSHDHSAKSGEQHKSSCSACASCCVGAGITGPSLIEFGSPELSSALPAAPLLAHARLSMGGLERPPRTHLA